MATTPVSPGVTTTVTYTPTPSTTTTSTGIDATSATPSTTEPSPSDASSTTDTGTAPQPQGTDVVVPQDAAGNALTLSQFFNPGDDWTEARFNVASKSAVQGLASEVSSCTTGYGTRRLELRLENRFQTISFTAGQSNQSKTSTQKVVVEVLANNRQVESRSIPFNVIQPFSLPVKDVNSLVMQAHLDDAVPDCGNDGAANLVVMDVVVK